jgi:DNA ligase (NAD+)
MKKSKIKKLENEIRQHRWMYYNDLPEITDDEFDKLLNLLKDVSPDSKVIDETGAPPKKKKVKLPYKLGSLTNKGIDDIIPWMTKQKSNLYGSYKLDGLSIYAEWKNGILKLVTTKGDGEYGEDITQKAMLFKGMPRALKKKVSICARGEAVIFGDLPEGYKTKRNAMGGIINRDDIKDIKSVMVLFYELISAKKMPALESLRFRKLSRYGLLTPHTFVVMQNEIRTPKGKKFITNFLENTVRGGKETLPYNVDGVVLTADVSEREDIKFPKNKIAFKIENQPVETVVNEIVNQVTRLGYIIPVVHIGSIDIEGVEVKHPTGHNYNWLRKKQIGKGAIIGVVRSGDVIPYIKTVIKPGKVIIPRRCPSCDYLLKWEGVHLLCNNPKCKGSKIAQVEHFIRTMGAKEISAPTLTKLNCTSVRRFYMLTKEQISNTEGMGDVSADTFIEERNKTLHIEKYIFLAALGIPLVGERVSRKIIDHAYPKDIEHIFTDTKATVYGKCIDIEGIGPAVSTYVSENIKSHYKTYRLLKKLGLRFSKKNKTNRLNGESFQFTGAMELPRKEMESLVINNGGRISSVNKKLDYLVCNKNETSTKTEKADKLGIKKISELKFMNKLRVK